jgi:hypothetical protein
VTLFGSYLGEAIRTAIGGEWIQDDNVPSPTGWALRQGDITMNVYARAAQWLRDGNEFSLVKYLEDIEPSPQ